MIRNNLTPDGEREAYNQPLAVDAEAPNLLGLGVPWERHPFNLLPHSLQPQQLRRHGACVSVC